MEQLIKSGTIIVSSLVEGLAAVLIVYAVLRAAIGYLSGLLFTAADAMAIRLGLGKSLALALEMFLAADILRTAIAPTWDDIGKLIAIAALRTSLNYVLERELNHQ